MTTKVEPPKLERGELARVVGMKNELHIVLGPDERLRFMSPRFSNHFRVVNLKTGKRYTVRDDHLRRLKRDKQ